MAKRTGSSARIENAPRRAVRSDLADPKPTSAKGKKRSVPEAPKSTEHAKRAKAMVVARKSTAHAKRATKAEGSSRRAAAPSRRGAIVRADGPSRREPVKRAGSSRQDQSKLADRSPRAA